MRERRAGALWIIELVSTVSDVNEVARRWEIDAACGQVFVSPPLFCERPTSLAPDNRRPLNVRRDRQAVIVDGDRLQADHHRKALLIGTDGIGPGPWDGLASTPSKLRRAYPAGATGRAVAHHVGPPRRPWRSRGLCRRSCWARCSRIGGTSGSIQLIILGFESMARIGQSVISKSPPRIQPRTHNQHLPTRGHHPAEIGGFALWQF